MNTKLTRALAAFLGAASLVLAAGAARADDRPATPAPAVAAKSGSKARFKTLDQAVRAGRVDRRLVTGLRRKGQVDGIITFEQTSILDSAQATAAVGARARKGVVIRDAIDAAVPALASMKRRVFRSARRDVKLLEDLRHVGLSYARFDSERGLLRIANSPHVAGVRANDELVPELAQSLGQIRQPTAVAAGHRGQSTYVAVLDTGVNYRHSDFGCTALGVPATCRVSHAWDVYRDDGLLDPHSHGTNVSGIVAGVAPGTKVIGVDIFNRDGTNDWYAARGIEKVIELQRTLKTIAAVNLSVGSRDGFWSESVCSAGEYSTAFESLRQAGIVPVVSAGNDG